MNTAALVSTAVTPAPAILVANPGLITSRLRPVVRDASPYVRRTGLGARLQVMA